MPGITGNAQTTLETLDRYALYVYTAELILRMISYGT
jgi:hypothetical protein